MASEIRVLEDQLYEADYHNRVLHDELNRAKVKAAQVPLGKRVPRSSTVEPRPEPDSTPRRRRQEGETRRREPEDQMGKGLETDEELESMDDLELPMVDEGVGVDPEALTDPIVPDLPLLPGEADTSQEPSPAERLQPPPGGPEPPGKNDTGIPQIVPGELLPPPTSEDDEIKPPGQVELPDSILSLEGVPQKLRIHRALSGGHRVDGHLDSVFIVINVVDRLGRTIDLSEFDVDAELSIVILDPLLEASQARLGRWDFSSDQVSQLVGDEPISGIHVPIEWQDREPSGQEVIVHVRLRSEEDQMRCEARLNVQKQPAVAEWTPRGESMH